MTHAARQRRRHESSASSTAVRRRPANPVHAARRIAAPDRSAGGAQVTSPASSVPPDASGAYCSHDSRGPVTTG